MSWRTLGRSGCRHLGVKSSREWKEQKRAELREAFKALDDVYLGCAYTPAYHHLKQARDLLESAKDTMSQREWGR